MIKKIISHLAGEKNIYNNEAYSLYNQKLETIKDVVRRADKKPPKSWWPW